MNWQFVNAVRRFLYLSIPFVCFASPHPDSQVLPVTFAGPLQLKSRVIKVDYCADARSSASATLHLSLEFTNPGKAPVRLGSLKFQEMHVAKNKAALAKADFEPGSAYHVFRVAKDDDSPLKDPSWMEVNRVIQPRKTLVLAKEIGVPLEIGEDQGLSPGGHVVELFVQSVTSSQRKDPVLHGVVIGPLSFYIDQKQAIQACSIQQ